MSTVKTIYRGLTIGVVLFSLGLTVFSIQQKVEAQAASWCTLAFYDELKAHFLQTVPPAPAYLDLNGDGTIDLTDYSLLVQCYNAAPPVPPPDNNSGSNQPPPDNNSGNNPPDPGSQPTPAPAPTLSSLVYGSSTPFREYNLRIIEPSGVNIRSGPGLNYDIIGRAVYGGNFEFINDTVSGWYQIRFNDRAGWVNAAYVEVDYYVDSSSTLVPTSIPINMSDFEEECVAVPSATPRSRYLNNARACIESVFENRMTEEEVSAFAGLFWDCHVVIGTVEFAAFLTNLSLTGDPVLSAEISFPAEDVANCINDYSDLIEGFFT